MTKATYFSFLGLMAMFFLLGSCSLAEVPSSEERPVRVVKSAIISTLDSSAIEKIMKKPIMQIDSSIPDAYLLGKFDPVKHSDFALVKKVNASREGMYLRKEAYNAFLEMAAAAKKENIHFQIKSATRNFAAQKRIWEAKWNGERLLEGGQNAAKAFPSHVDRALKILEYSSMPGTSRHHWGTDMDLNSFVNSYFEKGKGLKEYNWLTAHAAEYGFCQPYTEKGAARPAGYNEEKWHWSYLPIAVKLTEQYQLRIKDGDISGFEGAKVAKEIGVVQKYVLGINKTCLEK